MNKEFEKNNIKFGEFEERWGGKDQGDPLNDIGKTMDCCMPDTSWEKMICP